MAKNPKKERSKNLRYFRAGGRPLKPRH